MKRTKTQRKDALVSQIIETVDRYSEPKSLQELLAYLAAENAYNRTVKG